jgi:hypothetical protein
MVMMGSSDEADDRTVAIRRFFLYSRERYTLRDLAQIWRVPEDVVVAMFFDELNAARRNGANPLTFEVSADDAMEAANAFHVFRAIEVEQALADDFESARRDDWRTIPLVVHLPLFVADSLGEYPFLPDPGSLAARAERLLFEFLQVDRILNATTQNDD